MLPDLQNYATRPTKLDYPTYKIKSYPTYKIMLRDLEN